MKKIVIKLLLALMLMSSISINVLAEDNVIYVDDENDFVVEESVEESVFVLDKDITLSKALEINVDTSLYLNGKTLTIQEQVIETDEDGFDVIKEGTEYGILVNKTLNIYGGNPTNEDGDGIIQGAFEQTDEGIELKSGVLINVKENGTLNLYSGTLRYGCSVNGGGIANEGTTNMYGGLITSCLSQGIGGGHGGGIWNGKLLNIYDGQISNCSAHVGGGIYNWIDAKTYIEKIDIEGCSAAEAGGGIYTAGESELIVNTTKPKTNNDLYDAEFLIKNCFAGYLGGAIAISPGDKVELKGDIMIVLNHAPRCAGIANGAMAYDFDGYLKIAGKVVIMGNDDGETRQRSNLAIMSDSYVTVDGDLLPGTEIGVHMYEFCEGDVVMVGLDPSIGPGYLDDDKIQIVPDYDPIEEIGDEGDSLINDKGTLRIKLATFEVSFDTDGQGDIEPQYVKRGRYATKPKLDLRYGYELDDWYNEEYDHLQWDFDFNTVETNITLKAFWKQTIDSEDISKTIDADKLQDLSIKYTEGMFAVAAIEIYDLNNDTILDRWILDSEEEIPCEIKDLDDGRKEIIVHKSYLKDLQKGKYELRILRSRMDEHGEISYEYLTKSLFEIKKKTPKKPDFKNPSTGIE